MRPVASSRRRHASAQRRDPQSKLGSLNREDCLEAEKLLEKVFGRYRRMLGQNHPYTKTCESQLHNARVMARMRSQFG